MKIPKQAKKVFDGIIFNVYQWEQKMFDSTTETFEMLKRTNTIQIIPIMGDKIVLINEEQPTIRRSLGVVGGRQNKDEEPLECAKRELLEETGLISNDWELISTHEPYVKIEWTICRFVARNCKKQAEQKLDAGEKIELKLVDFGEFMRIIIDDDFRSKDIAFDILKMHYNNTLEEFKQKLFKKAQHNHCALKYKN